MERTFAGGEYVAVDCASETVQVDGMDARVDVTLGSDFFSLGPGYAMLSYAGCSSHDCYFYERWA